jgi:hypothetical protein
MPAIPAQIDANSSNVMFTTTIDDVTRGSGETPPSQAVEGFGAQMFGLPPLGHPTCVVWQLAGVRHKRPAIAAVVSAALA